LDLNYKREKVWWYLKRVLDPGLMCGKAEDEAKSFTPE
jgi:hypothetical protein